MVNFRLSEQRELLILVTSRILILSMETEYDTFLNVQDFYVEHKNKMKYCIAI